MRSYKKIHLILLVLLVGSISLLSVTLKTNVGLNFFPANILGITITTEDLLVRYNSPSEKLKILLVPGHDNKYNGAVYRGLKESDINIDLSKHLFYYLSKDQNIDVQTVRNFNDGNYTDEMNSFFKNKRDEIINFQKERRHVTQTLLRVNELKHNVTIEHQTALPEIALRLYGINLWANQNQIDLSLHIHFNDNAGRRWSQPGKYSGFSIYVPEKQFPNAKASTEIAEHIFNDIKKINPRSNFPLEKDGVIEAQELIALGSNASQKGGSVLIEYGYIYEYRFQDPEIRELLVHELAFQTYRSIKKYFSNSDELPRTTFLPFLFSETLRSGDKGHAVLSLQTALLMEGLYPPQNKNLNDCPITGYFGSCTEVAVDQFQEKYRLDILEPLGLSSVTGIVGPSTIDKLNMLYYYQIQ